MKYYVFEADSPTAFEKLLNEKNREGYILVSFATATWDEGMCYTGIFCRLNGETDVQ